MFRCKADFEAKIEAEMAGTIAALDPLATLGLGPHCLLGPQTSSPYWALGSVTTLGPRTITTLNPAAAPGPFFEAKIEAEVEVEAKTSNWNVLPIPMKLLNLKQKLRPNWQALLSPDPCHYPGPRTLLPLRTLSSKQRLRPRLQSGMCCQFP